MQMMDEEQTADILLGIKKKKRKKKSYSYTYMLFLYLIATLIIV